MKQQTTTFVLDAISLSKLRAKKSKQCWKCHKLLILLDMVIRTGRQGKLKFYHENCYPKGY